MLFQAPPADALAWADRLYAPLRDKSCEAPVRQAAEALEAYRALSRRYPEDSRSYVGAGRCLFRMGRYEASALQYRKGKVGEAELATAEEYARTSKRFRGELPVGHSVCHLVRMSRDRWVAVTGRIVPDETFRAFFVDAALRPFRMRGDEVSLGAQPTPLHLVRDDCLEIGIYAPPALRPSFVVQSDYPQSGASPNKVHIVDGRRSQLRVTHRLDSTVDTEIWMAREKLCISVEPTYKVYWPDVYEWANGTLSFANFHHPASYPASERPWKGEEREYTAWMWQAAVLTIHRRRGAALRAWREAERCAKQSIRDQARGLFRGDSRYPDYGYYGATHMNLRQIRQRIAWLRQGEWNHWLLYRPYDYDLFIPPYRLGNASEPG